MLHLDPDALLRQNMSVTALWKTHPSPQCPQVDALLVGSLPQAPPSALGVVLGAVVATGVLDGVSQGAVFVDAAQAGQQYTHVSADSAARPVLRQGGGSARIGFGFKGHNRGMNSGQGVGSRIQSEMMSTCCLFFCCRC